jgi:LmbE family N-acetylglucosaminyl deacetylase
MIGGSGPITVLHLAPHPDDEAIGAVATLLALRDAGHRVINYAVSLGSDPSQRERRRAEVGEACGRAGFELVVHDGPLDEPALRAAVRALVDREGVDVLVSPSEEDRHPAHEPVGRAARDVAAAAGLRWWAWGLWGELRAPTLYFGFDEAMLSRAQHVLAAHAGELARNDYLQLLRDRAGVARVLGAERVFGWGSAVRPEPFAELLREYVPREGGALAPGPPRVLDPVTP